MKTITLALAASAVLLAGAPAFAQQAASAADAAKPASATATAPRTFAVGQRLTSGYASGKYLMRDYASVNLPAPPMEFKWYVVGETAYLVSENTDKIAEVRTITPKS